MLQRDRHQVRLVLHTAAFWLMHGVRAAARRQGIGGLLFTSMIPNQNVAPTRYLARLPEAALGFAHKNSNWAAL